MVVYPPLPVPKAGRDSDARIRKSGGDPDGGGPGKKRLLIGAVVVALGGAVLGFCARPRLAPDGRIADLEGQVDTAGKATASAKAHGDELQAELDTAVAARKTAEARIKEAETAKSELADKAADAEKKAKEAESVEEKLRATVDKTQGSVSSEGDEIHLQLVDKVLFKTGDDQLTDKGKAVLDKVAVALRDLPDKQIWVQGHTDDQPIFVPPAGPPKKLPKGTPPPPAPVARFQTNWELSAARALQVVHYLQDVAKLDPARLAALAFGQYRPVSRTNKALNRRIEIVLYPKRQILAK